MHSSSSLPSLLVCALLAGCASDSGLHFEGKFLRQDGTIAKDIRVALFNDRYPFSGVELPNLEVFSDSQGRYQIDVSLADISNMSVLSIVGGGVAVRVSVNDEWLGGARNYDLGEHQFWSGALQATPSNTEVAVNWGAPVDQETPAINYVIEMSGSEKGVWIEETDASSVAIDVRKIQDFARTAFILAKANVWGGITSGFSGPPIEIWWRSVPVDFAQTSSIPISRTHSCTTLRNGAEEPFSTPQAECYLTDAVVLNTGFPSDGCSATTATANQAFTIDLGMERTVGAIGLLLLTLTEEVPLDVQISTDNANFTTVDSFSPSPSRHRFQELATPSLARYVRLKVDTGCIFRLGEIGIY